MVITYEDSDLAVRAFYTLRESSYEDKNLLGKSSFVRSFVREALNLGYFARAVAKTRTGRARSSLSLGMFRLVQAVEEDFLVRL